eukprot:TRINITY_DN5282_c0_g2_i1.p1 TRINITY_DN5282_c0_g2~~TRINITY_DN5282_c0_g2_i1.p1  ORF type:complete len:357 (-),score=78.99 TRINITY_DN5282_c0_g2_i1:90-1160(-)
MADENESESSVAKALKAVKLHKLDKAKDVHDSSKPKLSGFISDADVSEYQDTVIDSNIEYWIDALGDLTFHTEFYPLSKEDAQTFIDCYAVTEQKQKIPDELLARLSKIEDGLEKVIVHVKGGDSGVFVKTSSRSAKDTGIYHEKFRELYKQFLAKRPGREENDKIIALLEAGTLVLKLENAKQVLQMFSISERISQDMKLALAHPARFKENFVVRKWVDLDPSLEFRGFVNNNKLNALSQYNHLGFFQHIVDQKDLIVKEITEFFYEKALPRLEGKYKKYIIDFALVKEGDKYKIWVIELNPFLETTDSCLFSWGRERDLLENGPFEFRYRTQKTGGVKAMLANSWRDILNDPTL